ATPFNPLLPTTYPPPTDPADDLIHTGSSHRDQDTASEPIESMITTITAQEVARQLGRPCGNDEKTLNHTIEQLDSRSSSLSDLDEGSDERDDFVGNGSGAGVTMDNESEAETERLENTPRAVRKSGQMWSRPGDVVNRTPSKLAQEVEGDGNILDPESPSNRINTADATTLADDVGITNITRSKLWTQEPALDEEEDTTGKKRKRSSGDVSSLSEFSDIEAPAAKRSSSSKLESIEFHDGGMKNSVGEEEDVEEVDTLVDPPAREEVDPENHEASVEDGEVPAKAPAHLNNLAKARKSKKKTKK
ncbi:hypothetical protein LTS18_014692, partial [Coniosporium uncinatum]